MNSEKVTDKNLLENADEKVEKRTHKLNKGSEELRNTETLLSDITNLSSDIIYVKDIHSRWIFVNPALERIIGRKADKLLGKNDLEIYSNPEIGKTILENDRRIIDSGKEETLEEIIETSEGIRSFISVKTPRFNDKGQIIGIIGISHDNTLQKIAEQKLKLSEQKYHSLYTSMNEGVAFHEIIYNSQHKPEDYIITDINHAFETIIGLKQSEVVGKKASEIYGTGNPPYIEIYANVAEKGEPKEFETFFEPMDKYFKISVIASEKGKFATIFEDITKRKMAEKRSQDLLTKEKQLTEKLQRSNEKLQQKEKDMAQLNIALRKSEKRVRLKLETILSPEGDIGKLDLADLLDVKAIQSLMDNYYKTFQLPIAMIDTKGEILAGVGWQDICTQFHRVNHETKKHCIESDTQLTVGVPKGEFKLYKCKNNMWDIATPIIVGGKHLGNIFSGQFFFEDEELDYELFKKQAKEYDFDEEKYISALKAVPKVSRQTVNEGMVFFTELSDMISQMSYSNLNLARSLKERDKLLENEQQLTEELQTSNEELQIVTEELRDSNAELQIQGEGLVHVNQALLESEKRMNRSQEIAHLGSWELDIDKDCLSWSDEVYRIFGLQPQEFDATYEAFLDNIHPDDREVVNEAYLGSIREDHDTYEIEHRVVRKSTGEIRVVYEKCEHIRDNSGRIVQSLGLVHDITEQKQAEKALQESLIELERSNAELEQFAYITSHDLREPLRMITSFLQLLERRYKNQLDADANEFIGYAVDGAKRLDAMIQDILIYSKIAKERNFTYVNINNVLEQTYLNLRASIDEKDAEIIYDKLPTIVVDEKLMIQLFQNLISNAIKYHGDESPKIQISAKNEGNQWLFSVKDNGIGISKKHLKKIFTIFQRLHTNEEYEGTGIGLAIAQKIVHQHDGKIWVESEPGKGSTFYFTIPILPIN
jgi:PAS domain S-box-containing protein